MLACLYPLAEYAGVDPDDDWLDGLAEYGLGTDPCINDMGASGCTDAEETALGDSFDPDAWYDVYDVPVPAEPDAEGSNGKRNKVVDIGDVLAVLAQAFVVDCTAEP